MPSNDLEDIKSRLDIVEFIGSYVTLKKAGANYKGLCPFHNEKTPSLMVSPEKQIFKCFGCNEGGDIFSFLMKVEGLSFGDALKTLAEKAGIELKPRHFDGLSSGEKPGQKSRMLELNDLAARLYHKILADHPKADKARAYLEGRGIKRETLDDFNLGYAPASWDLLIRFAESRGFSEKELLVAGLSVRKTTGPNQNDSRISYDRFRERIVFPINNVLGGTVGFTGRLLADKDDAPKYLNSSESPVYQKSLTIYGLDKAKMAIKQADQAVIVEGNMDVIACHQAGFKNVVAVSGTALTREMLTILSRYTFNLAFSFDGDAAGQLAMKRAISMAGELDINPKIISLPPEFKDPDEAIKKDPKIFMQAIADAVPALEHLINIASESGGDIAKKKAVLKEILPIVKLLKSQTEKDHYLKMLARKLIVSEQVLKEEMRFQKTEVRADEHIDAINRKSSEEILLLSILNEDVSVLGAELKPTIESMIENKALGEKFDLRKLFTFGDQPEFNAPKILKDKLKEVYLSIIKDLEPEVEIKTVARELMEKIRKKSHENRKNQLLAKIAEADARGDKEARLRLLRELNSAIVNKDN